MARVNTAPQSAAASVDLKADHRAVSEADRERTLDPDRPSIRRERANWHPHLHLLVTDGGLRPHGTCVAWPVHDTTRLTKAFRRAVRRLFVCLELFDEDEAASMRPGRTRGSMFRRPSGRSPSGLGGRSPMGGSWRASWWGR